MIKITNWFCIISHVVLRSGQGCGYSCKGDNLIFDKSSSYWQVVSKLTLNYSQDILRKSIDVSQQVSNFLYPTPISYFFFVLKNIERRKLKKIACYGNLLKQVVLSTRHDFIFFFIIIILWKKRTEANNVVYSPATGQINVSCSTEKYCF